MVFFVVELKLVFYKSCEEKRNCLIRCPDFELVFFFGGEVIFFVGFIVTMQGEEGFCEMGQSYYAILGVSADSSDEEIRRAYRKLAMVMYNKA